MKKKCLCLLSALLIVFSLAACGSDTETADKEKSDFDSFMTVQKNMEQIKDAEFKVNMETAIPSRDGDYNMTVSGTAKEIKKAKDDIQMELKYKMNMAGTDMSGTMYMKDKALYTEFMGQKVKTDTSNEMGAMMKVDTDELLSITEEMISDLKVSRDGEDTVYNFTMDPTKAMDYMAKNVSGAEGITDADGKLTFDKANISVTADKNDMAKKIDVDFSLKAKLDEETVAMKFKTTVEFVSINTDLTIDFPDFEGYQEMTV